MSTRRTQLPLSVVLPVVAALLSTYPAITHDDVAVRRLAFAIALCLLGFAAIAVVIWVHTRLGRTERSLNRKVDAWGALATYLHGEPAAASERPVHLEQVRRRRRCALLRATDSVVEHTGVATGLTAVGALAAVALVAGGGMDSARPGPAGGPTHDAGPSAVPAAPSPDQPAGPAPTAGPGPAPATITVTATVTPPAAVPVALVDAGVPAPSSPATARSATSESTTAQATEVAATSSAPSTPPEQSCAVDADVVEVGCRRPLVAAGAGHG